MAKKLFFSLTVILFFNIQSCRNTYTGQISGSDIDDYISGLQHVKSGNTTYIISAYDDIMIEIGQSEGHDWRMIAAIAYCESRFKHDSKSHRGARGIMQIMPIVARQFDVPTDKIMDPRTNVLLAAKLLNMLDNMLNLDRSVPYIEKMKFILASYNSGIGHVKDARNLAGKYGADPNSWEDVSHYLKLKSDPEVAKDEVVRYGRIKSGSGVVAFVDKVVGKYQSYCQQHP